MKPTNEKQSNENAVNVINTTDAVVPIHRDDTPLSLTHSDNKQNEPFRQAECREQTCFGYAEARKGARSEIIIYQPDSTMKLDVLIENETVWLTQAQMAELFDKDRTVIGRHINNIFKEGELERDITCANFAHVGIDADQQYVTTLYNLDMIISVGYRVKSRRGILFRRWASKVLKEYLLRGYAVNQKIIQIEDRIDRRLSEHDTKISELRQDVDFFVKTALPPREGVFFDGQIFDAYRFVCDLVGRAKERIVLIDNYVDGMVLSLLDKRSAGVSAQIYTQNPSSLKVDLKRHNAQYPPIDVAEVQGVHDRFLIVDDTVYHIGASIKDLGKKLFAFSKMELEPDVILGRVIREM